MTLPARLELATLRLTVSRSEPTELWKHMYNKTINCIYSHFYGCASQQ